MFQILDCTLRDGGYYTNWDFDPGLVRTYLHAMARLPVSCIELGYRCPMKEGYSGEYYHLPRTTIEEARAALPNGPDFALMLDAKNNEPGQVPALLRDCRDLVRLVRLAVDPADLDHGLALAEAVREFGFEVGLNLMYLSNHWDDRGLFEDLAKRAGFVQCIALVDSFGGCYPDQVGQAFKIAGETLKTPLGFHGHDNLMLAFANAIAAIDNGASVIDATVLGMGRGAGNLRTEIIGGYYGIRKGEALDLLPMARVIEEFKNMQNVYQWGSALPYIVSGFGGLPQKEVMNWLSKNRYSTFSIVNALQGKKIDRQHGDVFETIADARARITNSTSPVCIVVGGGPTGAEHANAIIDCARRANAIIVHSSTRNIRSYLDSGLPQVLCLVGDESSKIDDRAAVKLNDSFIAFALDDSDVGQVDPPDRFRDRTYNVTSVRMVGIEETSALGSATPLGTALGVARGLNAREVWLAGFDGYQQNGLQFRELEEEVRGVLGSFIASDATIPISSLTPTHHDIKEISVYCRIATVDA